MKDRRSETGRLGESIAREHISALGWLLVESNWRCRTGEIDIIARDGNDLVFIEVRTRSSARFGTGAESVDWRKQKQVRTLAAIYLAARHITGCRIRFDMISIQLHAGVKPLVEHIRNAF